MIIKNIIVSIVLVTPKTAKDKESPLLDKRYVVSIDGIPDYKTNSNR